MSLKLGANMTVFILFFAMALYEAVVAHNWWFTAILLALGVIALRADSLKGDRASLNDHDG
jgi:hypothetical protein